MDSKAWLSLCVLHAVASMLVWWAGDAWAWELTWRADTWLSRPWTLWTTAWVHINTPHLIGNQLAVGALAAAAWLMRPHAGASLAWLVAWPLLPPMLLWWPQVGYYVGLSGLVHAAVAVLAMHLVLGEMCIPKARRWGWMLLTGLAAKLLIERAWLWPVVWHDAADMSIVQVAHLSGAALGAVLALGLLRRRSTGWWSPTRLALAPGADTVAEKYSTVDKK